MKSASSSPKPKPVIYSESCTFTTTHNTDCGGPTLQNTSNKAVKAGTSANGSYTASFNTMS